jgi:hypothetical protein
LAAALLLAVSADAASAQSRDRYPLIARATATGEELANQPNLWALEVQFKPMRFINVPVTDPATGKQRLERVWYLVYKAVNRPLGGQAPPGDTLPLNDDDPEPLRPLFVPEFELLTDDTTDGRKVSERYRDEIVPGAEPFINAREKRVYQNSADVVQELPDPVPPGEETDQNTIYGVAMWRGVPAETDYFTVFMGGFSNGYRYVQGPVKFETLRQMARGGQLDPTNAVWDGMQFVKTASESCNWMASGDRVLDRPREWEFGGNVPGLFNDIKPPAAGAENYLWLYTLNPSQFAGQGQQGPQGQPPVWRRTIRQDFSRFGDRFEQREEEFRACGEPTWIYQAAEIKPTAPTPPADAAPLQPATTEPSSP